MRRVLGVDPGLAATGYAVVAEEGGGFRLLAQGTVRTAAEEPLPARLGRIHAALSQVVAAWDPWAVALEDVYLAKNAPSAMYTAQVTGVVLLLAQGRRVFHYAPRAVKRWICGNGGAPKEQVWRMVAHLLGAQPSSDHAADAAALALCALLEARP
ncbi:MAG: crossover junction endodeoxyribonuclease RuvC [Candidatus Bipolaricaulota bacterium]|nr:crossover junction endodeoxyribonuclease RuvC [Candidatus Bipolaricaulota bacterium]